jgi:GNAT superfamily N-acetyltransferase
VDEVRVDLARFDRRDEDQAVRLLVERFPPEERQAAYEKRLARWRWQYYENPNNPDDLPSIWVARADAQVVGLVGTVPVRLRTPEGGLLALWALDLVVASSMRGMGLGKRLMTEVADAAPAVLGIGWTPAGLRADLAAGLRIVDGFACGNLVISPLRFGPICLRQKHYKDIVRLLHANLRAGFARGLPTREDASVSAEFPSGTDRLWNRVAGCYRFAVDRDTAYLEWRYSAHPTHDYRVLYIGPASDPKALAVYRLTGDSPPAGMISDLIVDPANSEDVLGLVGALIDSLRREGAYAASLVLPPALARHLGGLKYSVLRPMGLLVKTVDPALESAGIKKAESWYLSLSDSDQDY